MKRVKYGWMLECNNKEPFYIDEVSTGIDTTAVASRKWLSDVSRNSKILRVKITVETFKAKQRLPRLAPCANCGNKPRVFYRFKGAEKRMVFVMCEKCKAETMLRETEQLARERWNDNQKGGKA
jgi:hypothetical protein